MNFLKKLIVIGLELVVLYFIMRFIAMKWVLPELDYGGDAGSQAGLLFITVFMFNATFYSIFHLLNAARRKGFSTIHKRKKYILPLVGGVILLLPSAYIIAGMFPYVRLLWALTLFSIPLFLLHLGAAKLLAKKN